MSLNHKLLVDVFAQGCLAEERGVQQVCSIKS